MKLSDMKVRAIVADEVDPYPYDAEGQGDLIALARLRVATHALQVRDGALEMILRRHPLTPAAVRALSRSKEH